MVVENGIAQRTARLLSILDVLGGQQKSSIASNPEFQKKTVERAVSKASLISQEKQNALRRLFGDELDMLTIPETNKEQGVTNIFESLFDGIFDGGTSKYRKCEIPGVAEPFEAGSVPILTRSAFITRVLQEHNVQNLHALKGEDYGVSIGLIDIHNLRGADFELPNQEDKPADVLINKAARAIRNAFDALHYTSDEDKRKNRSWEIGRYGGDEFVIGLFGSFTPEEKKQLYDEVQRQLALPENNAYYQYILSDGDVEIKREPIQLKVGLSGKVVEEIEFPKVGDKTLTDQRLVFREYLERGLLLTNEEFQKVINKYSPNGAFDIALYRKDYPITSSQYPHGTDSLEKKIEHIQTQHPELAFYFDLAALLDKTDPHADKGVIARRQVLLETVESSLFDRLIGEAIYSRDQFQSYLRDDEFSMVATFDLKFIKEINEKATYADSDISIKKLWNKIQSCLEPGDREKVIVGRFGGTYAVGIRKGQELSLKTIENLSDIHTLTVALGDKTYEVPIANTWSPVQMTDENPALQDSRAVFRTILNLNEQDFYEKMLTDIIIEDYKAPDGNFIHAILNTDVADIIPSHSAISKAELYTLFLRGKRKLERIPKLLSSFLDGQKLKYFDPERLIRVVIEASEKMELSKKLTGADAQNITDKYMRLMMLSMVH